MLDYANRDMAGIDFLKNLPKDKGVQVGVLDIRTNAIETPEKIADRIRKVLAARPGREGHAQHGLRHEAAGAHGREDEAQGAGRRRRDRPQRSMRSETLDHGWNGKEDHCGSSARPARRAAGSCRAILADPNGGFAARAITRDPTKDKAKALAAKGAEVVQADLDDVESLKKAFAGAYGVYAVTNFWEHFSGEKEKAQAKNIAEAAKAAGVKHVIWSTLEDTRKLMAAGRQAHADAAGASTACRTSTRRPKPTRTSPACRRRSW